MFGGIGHASTASGGWYGYSGGSIPLTSLGILIFLFTLVTLTNVELLLFLTYLVSLHGPAICHNPGLS